MSCLRSWQNENHPHSATAFSRSGKFVSSQASRPTIQCNLRSRSRGWSSASLAKSAGDRGVWSQRRRFAFREVGWRSDEWRSKPLPGGRPSHLGYGGMAQTSRAAFLLLASDSTISQSVLLGPFTLVRAICRAARRVSANEVVTPISRQMPRI